MKKVLVVFLLVFNGFISMYAQEDTVPHEDAEFITEEQPSFPGGEAEMKKFIIENIHYPALAKENGVSGKVYVQFTIDTDGSIADVICIRGIGSGCDEEAVKVIKAMPKWTPVKQNGKPLKVRFTLPIQFQLQ